MVNGRNIVTDNTITIGGNNKENEIRNILNMQDCNMKEVTITPEMASIILTLYNNNNRRVDTNHVKRLSESMKSGNWNKSNDNITFDENWELSNGQHRLKAVIDSKTDIKVGVAFEVNQHFNMDRGKARTMADNIGLSTLVHNEELRTNKKVIEMMNVVLKCVDRVKYTQPEHIAHLMNIYEEDLLNFIDAGLMKGVDGFNQASVSAAIFLAYIFDVPLDKLIRFRRVLNDGIAKDKFDAPIIGARDKLMHIRGGGYGVNEERIKTVQYGINAVERNKTSKTCKSDKYYYRHRIRLDDAV